MIDKIKEFDKEIEEFDEAMERFSDSYFVCTIGTNLVNAVIDYLQETLEPGGDSVSWWLYETVEKKIWINEKEYDVTTPEALYDFMVEYGKRNE